jgi:hypothetical protein
VWVKAKPLVRRQAVGQTSTRATFLLCLHHAPIVPSLALREGVDRPAKVLTSRRVTDLGPLIPHHRATGVSRPLVYLIFQGRLPLVPCHHRGPGSTGSRPGAIATAAPPWGTAAPLHPRPCP